MGILKWISGREDISGSKRLQSAVYKSIYKNICLTALLAGGEA
jgi:hypothetical protein